MYTLVSRWVGTWADKAEKLEKMCQECPLMPQTDLGRKLEIVFGTAYFIHLSTGYVCVRGIIIYGLLICLR